MRRAPSIDALIPALYLKGVSTSSFPEALSAILGENAVGLSPANIVRLKQIWDEEYREWKHRDLSDKHYVYVWADGIYFQVRLEPDRPCVLVIIGATKDGRKELLAIEDGHRESKLSWEGVLTDLKRRGLKEAPALAIGDGGLGFWAALEEVFPQTRHQRCWVHKSANVLDNLPKTVQAQAKARLHQMYLSPTRQDALGASTSCPCMKPDTPRPAPAWKKTRTCCSPFTISQPPTGDTSVPPIIESTFNRPPPHTPDQRMRIPKCHHDDGLQTGQPSKKWQRFSFVLQGVESGRRHQSRRLIHQDALATIHNI